MPRVKDEGKCTARGPAIAFPPGAPSRRGIPPCAAAGQEGAEDTADPFAEPIEAEEGVVVVSVEPFATVPDVDGEPARMMTLVHEPGMDRLFLSDPGVTDPVAEYDQQDPLLVDRAAVTGLHVVRDGAGRVDLRLGTAADGRIFLLNKHDGVLRVVVPESG